MLQRGTTRSTLLLYQRRQITWAQSVDARFKLCCSRDDRIAGVSAKGVVRYGKVDGRKSSLTIRANTQVSGVVTAIDLSVDKSTVAVGFASGLLKIFNTRSGQLLHNINLPDKITKIAHSIGFMTILHDTGSITYYTDNSCVSVDLEPAIQITSNPWISVILTRESIVICFNNGLFTPGDPLVFTEEDDLSMASVSIYSMGQEQFISYSIGHHMTVMKYIIEGDSCSLLWQESLRFEHPMKNLAIVNVLEDAPFTVCLDAEDKMYIVIGTSTLEWESCGDKFMPEPKDVKSFPWSLQGNTLTCTGTNMSVTTVDIADIAEFLKSLQAEINTNAALVHADNIASVLPVFQRPIIPLIDIALNRVRIAVESNAVTDLTKDLIQKLILIIDKFTLHLENKREYMASAMLHPNPNFEETFFEILYNTYQAIDLNNLPSDMITTFIRQLVAREAWDKVDELVLRFDIGNFNFADVATILHEQKLWSSFITVCCRGGLSHRVFDVFMEVLEAAEHGPEELAFFNFLRNHFGLDGGGDEDTRNQVITWLLNDNNRALDLILTVYSEEFLQVLREALSAIYIPLSQFVPLVNACLTIAMLPKFVPRVTRSIFELVARSFDFRKYINAVVWNNLFTCLLFLINNDTYFEDTSPMSMETTSCVNAILRNTEPELLDQLKSAAIDHQKLYLVALCAECQRDFIILIEALLHENFPFTSSSIHFALEIIQCYTADLLAYDDLFLQKLYDRMYRSTPCLTVDCIVLYPESVLNPEFSCELFLALVSKNHHNKTFMANMSHEFMTNFITVLVERFSDQNSVCDEMFSNCLLSNDLFLEHAAVETDYCLNVASANNMVASKILLSLARRLPEMAFIDAVGYVSECQNVEQLDAFIMRILQFAEMFVEIVINLELFPKLIVELVRRVVHDPTDILYNLCDQVFFLAVGLNAPSAQIGSMAESIAATFPQHRYYSLMNRAFTELALSTEMTHILHHLVNQEGQEQLHVQLQVNGFEVENQLMCPVCNAGLAGGSITVLDGKMCHTTCLQN
uniref:Rod_C domain-containing protein n=1 Tax=Panagrellus redivivus TaxID=6233 RepID=A0A7E4ZU37_PANRE